MGLRFTEEEYMEYLEKRGQKTARQKPKRNKYNAKKTWVDGICFDSKREADYYNSLKLLMRAGEIKGFCRQPEFILTPGDEETRATTYKADFIVFHKDDRVEIVDVKGFETENFKLKQKMFKEKYPNLELRIVK